MPNFIVRILQQFLGKMKLECLGINPYIARASNTKIPNRTLLPNYDRRFVVLQEEIVLKFEVTDFHVAILL